MVDLTSLAEHLRRVTVEVTDANESLGSGVLWPRGCVVTNAHVGRRARAGVGRGAARRVEGEIVARDAEADLALLRVAGTGIPAAMLADAEALRVGSIVVAIGHPFGVRGALTA